MSRLLKSLNDEKLFINWWDAQTASCKFGFFASLIMGFVTHIYIYTNRFMNEDDLLLTKAHHNIPSGRWFNNVINNMNYQFILPVTIGLFQLAFLAVSVFLVCKAFEITRKFNAVLIAGLMCTFPAIAYTNGYLYEGAGYYFAVLLSVTAFYITKKYKCGFLPGGVLIMLSMAIYQSKVSVALMLSLIYLIVLVKDCDFKTLKKNIINFSLLAVLGGGFYFISLRIVTFITGIPLHDYRGIDEMHVISITELPQKIISVYGGFYLFFFSDFHNDMYYYHHTSHFLTAAYMVIFLIAGVFIFKNYKGVKLAWFGAFAALIPFAANFSSFFDSARLAHVLMIYAFVFVFVMFVVLSEMTAGNILLKRVFNVSVMFVIANFIIISNIFYLQIDTYFKNTFSLTTRILANIDPLIPYSQSRQIIVIGNFSENADYPHADSVFTNQNIRETGLLGAYIGFNTEQDTYKLASILSTRHGAGFNVVPYELYDAMRDRVIETQMPVFPRAGSVGIIDDVIVINMSHSGTVTGGLTERNTLLFETRHTVRGLNETYIYDYFIYRNGNMVQYVGECEALHEIELYRNGVYEIIARIQTADGSLFLEAVSDTIEIDLPFLTIIIDGNEIFDIIPVIKDGDIMIPLRHTAERLGAAVSWDEVSGAVVMSYNGREILINEETVFSIETEGITLVPLGFIAEFFNAETEYNPITHTVEIFAR